MKTRKRKARIDAITMKIWALERVCVIVDDDETEDVEICVWDAVALELELVVMLVGIDVVAVDVRSVEDEEVASEVSVAETWVCDTSLEDDVVRVLRRLSRGGSPSLRRRDFSMYILVLD